MGCSASAVPIEDGYVFRIADPPAMPANSRAAERERERSMNAGGAAKLGGKSEFGAKKWAGVRNTVKGANAFEQSGFRRAAREKSRSSEHGWLAKDIALGPGVSAAKFEMGRVIGTGLMGTVRVACFKKDHLYCVVKSVSKEYVCRHNDGRHIQSERTSLSQIEHPFIVTLFGTYQDQKHVHFVLEFVAGGELFSRLQRNSCFSAPVALFYLAEVFCALSHIHSKGWVYRDLKPENILLDELGHCKLVDFGFTVKPDESGVMRTVVGTPAYLSPEQLNAKFTNGYTRIVDWWSFGCITYELMVGLTPFCRDNSESAHAIYLRVLKGKITFPKHFKREPYSKAKTLVTSLLTQDISKRLVSPAEIAKHEWWNGMDWQGVAERRAVPPSKPELKTEGDAHYFDRFAEPVERPSNTVQIDNSIFSGF